MRALPVIISCIISFTSFSQVPPNPADKQQDLKVLNIYADGNNQLLIGKAFVNQTLSTKIFILSAKRTKEADGSYSTVLEFGNYDEESSPSAKLSFSFDRKVESVSHSVGMNDVIKSGLENSRKSYLLETTPITRSAGSNRLFTLTFNSKDPIVMMLGGVDGILNQ